jgi:tetratricopeptide (TPR) repeat protein
MGMLYLFENVDREKALASFEKAARYAEPKSKYHASFALLHAALIKRDLTLVDEAANLTAKAVELSPDFAEALYQNAQYNAQLNNAAESLKRLEKAVRIDRNYGIRADNDKVFDPIRKHVNKLFAELRDEAKESCLTACQPIERLIGDANGVLRDNHDCLPGFLFTRRDFADMTSVTRRHLDRNSYFDCWDAQPITESYVERSVEYLKSVDEALRGCFDRTIDQIKGMIMDEPAEDKDEIQLERVKCRKRYCVLTAWLVIVGYWVALWLVYHYQVLEEKGKGEELFAGLFLGVVGTVILSFFGAAGAKAIGLLWIISHVLYRQRDFSGFIAEKQKEMDSFVSARDRVFCALGPTMLGLAGLKEQWDAEGRSTGRTQNDSTSSVERKLRASGAVS